MPIDLRGLGEQIRAARLERGMTQEQLAERADLSTHYVGNLEQGVRAPSIACVMQLCTALGTTPDRLLKDSISQEMHAGLSMSVSKANTLRETVDVLADVLSDFLPLDDEESPALFGVPLRLIPKIDESPQEPFLSDILLSADSDIQVTD